MRIIEPHFGGYAASKGALMTAAQTLAKEVGADKIRVNSRRPGLHLGTGPAGLLPAASPSSAASLPTPSTPRSPRARRCNHIPTSEEIADAVLFFASDLSRAITGQALDVNGGHFFH